MGGQSHLPLQVVHLSPGRCEPGEQHVLPAPGAAQLSHRTRPGPVLSQLPEYRSDRKTAQINNKGSYVA